jgi:hypothetical protein
VHDHPPWLSDTVPQAASMWLGFGNVATQATCWNQGCSRYSTTVYCDCQPKQLDQCWTARAATGPGCSARLESPSSSPSSLSPGRTLSTCPMVMAALVASSAMAPHGLRCGMRSLNCMLSSFDCRQQSHRRYTDAIYDGSNKRPTICMEFLPPSAMHLDMCGGV